MGYKLLRKGRKLAKRYRLRELWWVEGYCGHMWYTPNLGFMNGWCDGNWDQNHENVRPWIYQELGRDPTMHRVV